MFEAARDGDTSACPCLLPKPHVGGGLVPPVSGTVEANGYGLARGADQTGCIGDPAPNFVITGSATVEVNGRPAARRTALTLHPGPDGARGVLLHGSSDVFIGGPSGGAALGDVGGGERMCQAVKATRATPGRDSQSYNNCGIESTRQIIQRATGSTIGEDELLSEALWHGLAKQGCTTWHCGGSYPRNWEDLAERHGVGMHRERQTMDNLAQAVAEGKGVITAHDVSVLWGEPNKGAHAVVVTGVEYDEDGRPKTVIYNDSGQGQCSARLDAGTFEKSFIKQFPMAVTDAPLP